MNSPFLEDLLFRSLVLEAGGAALGGLEAGGLSSKQLTAFPQLQLLLPEFPTLERDAATLHPSPLPLPLLQSHISLTWYHPLASFK